MKNHQINTLKRIVKAGGQNFIRNASLSVAAVAVMVITLTIVLFSIIANATFNNSVQQLTDRIDISVYLKDSVNDKQREKLISDLKNIPNVKSVEFVSKDKALADYKEANKDNLDLLLAISQTDNPLPATLRVKPRDPNKIEEIRNFIEKPDVKALQSEETSYSGDRKQAIDNIARATKFYQQGSIVGIIIFTLVSVLIIFNTIRITIFNRREELQIMRLLGATTGYIRGPFVVETILYGVVAAVISVSLLDAVFSVVSKTFEASTFGLLDISYANDYFAQNFWIILLLLLALGILIGAVSSTIATRRYLKFKTSK